MCLSGEIAELTPAQWNLALRAQALYKQAVPIIKHGTSRRFGQINESWLHPRGWQAAVRSGADRNKALVVIHTFGNAPKDVEVPLPFGEWQIQEQFPNSDLTIGDSLLCWPSPPEFAARVLLLSQ